MGAPGRAHMERPRYRARNEKCVAFPEGALTDFGFQKRGVRWVRAPAHLRALLCAQGQDEGGAIVFFTYVVCDALDRSPDADASKNKQPSNGGLSHRARDSGLQGDIWLR